MQEKKTALIAGASGIVGRGIAERLVGDGWRVLCASRSGGGHLPGTEGVAVDLLDAEACARAVAPHAGITHVFHAAFQPAPSRAAEVAPNLAMLRNVVEAVQQASPALRKVVLVTGAKFYGIQWGASSTPCRESDPRQLPPNFYYDQEDWLREASRSARWRWVNLIPPFVSGYAVGNPMNLVLGIGLYAAVCKELGMPLRFPGSVGAYEALHASGWAHSVEVWEAGELTGGLYGIAIGRAFFGESMFSRRSNASKATLLFLSGLLADGTLGVLDCQVRSPHLMSLGATMISRASFTEQLASLCEPLRPFRFPVDAPIPVPMLLPAAPAAS